MFDEVKGRLNGCFYTIFTPFLANEKIDYESLEKYICTLYKQGAKKFYAMAYNSRYSQLKHSEILELNEACITIVKNLDKDNIVIVGDPIHCSTKESAEFALHAKELGADLISLIMREKYFTDEQVLDHYAEIGKEAKIPILVHEMPFLSGQDGSQIHWPTSLIKSLINIPEIIALKEDAHNYEVTKFALSLEPRIRIIIAGRKSSLMQFRELGAEAYLNGISIINAEIGELFWKAYKGGDEEVLSFVLNELEAPFFDNCVSRYGWHRTNKALLQAAGFMHRRDRMPMPHINENEFKQIEQTYKQVMNSWQKRPD